MLLTPPPFQTLQLVAGNCVLIGLVPAVVGWVTVWLGVSFDRSMRSFCSGTNLKRARCAMGKRARRPTENVLLVDIMIRERYLTDTITRLDIRSTKSKGSLMFCSTMTRI